MYIKNSLAAASMDKYNVPVAHCLPGETVTFQTNDCFGGWIKTEDDLAVHVPQDKHNLATGPLYVDGAVPGDVLKVEILGIAVSDHGCQSLIPGDGPLGKYVTENYTKLFPIIDGAAVFNEKISIPIRPMIGVIGTAPSGPPVINVTPGEHGANMDNGKITEGSTVYLPVNVPGALLAMGDLHAVMGDGETSTCGLEIAGEVTARIDVVHHQPFPTPFLKTCSECITVASAETLDEAVRLAAEKMMVFLRNISGMSECQCITLLSLAGNMEVCQVVNPLKTARMTIPCHIPDAFGWIAP